MVSGWFNLAILALLLRISSCYLQDAQVVDEVVGRLHDDEEVSRSKRGTDILQTIRDKIMTPDNQQIRKTEEGVWHSMKKSVVPLITSDEAFPHDNPREKRDVIEEEKYYGAKNKDDSHSDSVSSATQWLPESVLPEDTQQTSIQESTNLEQALPLHATTEALLERQNGRGARGTDDGQWVKLQSYPRGDEQKDALTVVSPPPDDLSARMPRVNFVTQKQRLESSESRSERDSLPRAAMTRSTNDLRTDFMHPSVDNRARSMNLVPPPAVSSDPYYYPEESRRRYDERYPDDDMYVARNPYYDMTYARRTGYNEVPYRPRLDRYDNDIPYYDPIFPVTPVERPSITKPKRIIYYANLPEVVRTPPNVDLRNRYMAADPYRRFDDQYSRDGKVDYRFRNRYDRYPHGPYKKDVARARDLIGSGTDPQDKTLENDRQTTAKPEEKRSRETQSNLNSQQYPTNPVGLMGHNGRNQPYPDVARVDYMYRRYDQPSFQAAIDDPYIDRRD